MALSGSGSTPPAAPSRPAEAATAHAAPASAALGWRRFFLYAGVLLFLFSGSFLGLYRFIGVNDLYSHTLLIPVLSVYLVWTDRQRLQGCAAQASSGWAALFGGVGIVLLCAMWSFHRGGWNPLPQDWLAGTLTAFVLLLFAGGFLFLGRGLMSRLALPMALLIWIAPFPVAVEAGIEHFFQHASALAAAFLFAIVAAPALRDGMFFHFPGIVLEVARECSGIRSSIVLFITSWIAGYLFLRKGWTRLALALFVIPLGILRNGFRIFTIGMLCVHVGPEMVQSWVHRQGGPLFFALSLVPFALLLAILRRCEQRESRVPAPSGAG
jgi:exosortase C (VPDSG-CTERM-specific)